jgi:HK97 family phage portal protein
MANDNKAQPSGKVIPIKPSVAREIGDLVEKSWAVANNQDIVANELYSSEFQAFMDAQTLKSLFFSEDWVYICIDLIANKISSQPLVVMESTVEADGSETTAPASDHPLTELLEQPNEWQSYAQWMYSTSVELYLMGNAIIWQAPRSGQLITLPTENITLEFDSGGKVKTYSVTGVSEDDGSQLQALQSFKADEIIHLRRPNPKSLMWGLSPFIPGRKSILFNRYSQDYLNAFYLKQATPGLALSLDRTVNEDVALRQLRSFEMAYQGRKNMRRTLILPKGVSANPLTHSLSDQKLIDHIKLNRETICGLLKIPKHELGLQEAGSLGSEEYKIALRNFWESTLLPGMDMIAGMLTKSFQAELGESYFLQFDTSDVEALRDDLQKKADIAAKMLQAGLSLNEVRAKVWEQEASDVPGSDDPYVLVQQRASAMNFTPEPSPRQEEQRSVMPGSRKVKRTAKLEALRKAHTKALDDEEARTIRGLAREVIDLLMGFTSKALDVIEEQDKKPATKDLPSRAALEAAIAKAISGEFQESYADQFVKVLTSSVELGYDQGLDLVFNAEATQEIQALRARDERRRRLSLEARGLESFDQISKTHTERIMREVTEGQSRNESITQIMRRVADALGTPNQLAGKAETIARTETLTAVSLGQGAAVENAKEVIPGLKKVWLTAGDDRVRDSHSALDGDMIEVNETFANGLRYPRDTKSSDPSEVINCRCTMLLIPPDEDIDLET